MISALRAALVIAFAFVAVSPGDVSAAYIQTNLVTSATDPDLINPWGISMSPTSPFWVSDNGTGKSTLYNSAGVKQGLVVTMPGASPITGQVFNGPGHFNNDTFLFASEDGTINGWRGALGTTAELLYSVAGASYKGLAISTGKDTLFAADFATGALDLFDSTHASPIGSFSDPTSPAGFAPFNVQNLGGTIYVTFAKRDPGTGDDVAGPGNGFVTVFDPVAHTFTRLITGSAAGGTIAALNSPWGIAVAPGSFGEFANALLVGNFGDGEINAFNRVTGALLGTLGDLSNTPLVNPGLWGLTFGNGGNGGSPDSLYFTAGGANEDIGVFGRISAIPEPATLLLMALGLAGLGASRRRAS